MVYLPFLSLRFQSTLPVWGGTHLPQVKVRVVNVFQSTLPVWGGTGLVRCSCGTRKFQSTLPVWGGTAKAHKNSL